MGVVLALPFTYGMAITPSIILLTAMYVSGTYGGAITSILFRIPGEPMDVPLLWDGYAMARAGDPAQALGWTLFAALTGGLITATVMVTLAVPFAKVALTFDSPEYFAIVLFGFTSVVALGGGSLANAFISLFFGMLVSTVGVDEIYGVDRFTFGSDILRDGIGYLPVMVGAYGLGEVLVRLEQGFASPPLSGDGRIATRIPTSRRSVEAARHVRALVARRRAVRHRAGRGRDDRVVRRLRRRRPIRQAAAQCSAAALPEGIVAPQVASTASVGGHMVPLLTLGIPGSGATAVILGAFLLHGVQPGPQIFQTQSALVYAIFASVFLGVIGMGLLGYFAIRPLIKVLYLPEAIVSVFVVLFCLIGAYSEHNNISDLWMIVVFGIVGYLFERWRFPIAPMVLGCILGPVAETSFLTTMISYRNDWTVFFTRPVSAVGHGADRARAAVSAVSRGSRGRRRAALRAFERRIVRIERVDVRRLEIPLERARTGSRSAP